MENTEKTIREIQLLTIEHYDPVNNPCRPFCCYTFWKRHIYPKYGCSYRTYTQYLKVRYPDYTKDADFLLPKPRQYGTDAIRKIRAINEYMKQHYRLDEKPKITVKSVWKEFIKSHFIIAYSGFRVYSFINPDDIEDSQVSE